MGKNTVLVGLADGIAEDNQKINSDYDVFSERTGQRVRWICTQAKGNTILDIGCGLGVVSILLAREGKRCLGLDTNGISIEQAQKYRELESDHVQKNIAFVCADPILHNYAGLKFDTILVTGIFEHLLYPNRLLDRVASLLNTNGRLVVSLPLGITPPLENDAVYNIFKIYEALSESFFIKDFVLQDDWSAFISSNDQSVGCIQLSKLWEIAIDAFLVKMNFLHNCLSEALNELNIMRIQSIRRENEFLNKLKDMEDRFTVECADIEQKLADAATREEAYILHQKDLENTIKEMRTDFENKMADAMKKEAIYVRKKKEAEYRCFEKSCYTSELQDAFLATAIERDTLAAINRAQLYSLQRETQNTWGYAINQVLQGTSISSILVRLPFKLSQLWRAANQHSPKALGGASFSTVLEVFSNGGFDQVEDLLTQAAASHVVKANAYTVLARNLQNIDPKQASEAARRAYEADPQQYRRKWLAFRLYAAENILEAEELLATLPDNIELSESERGQMHKIIAHAKSIRESTWKNKIQSICNLKRFEQSITILNEESTIRFYLNKKANVIKKEGSIFFELVSNEIIYLLSKRNGDFNAIPIVNGIKLQPNTDYRLRGNASLDSGYVYIWIFEYNSEKLIDKYNIKVFSAPFHLDFKTGADHENICIAIRLQGKGSLSLKDLSISKIPTLVLHPNEQRLPVPGRKIADLRVAYIVDELTEVCLMSEVQASALTPESWREVLHSTRPDMVFVESCWVGVGGLWGTLTRGSGGPKKLLPIINECRQLKIPTVFWNKEDPVHYDKFLHTANLFDYLFTSDVNMIPQYRKDIQKEVYALPFAAQPKIHNPKLYQERLHKAVFAGSYYTQKQERCNDFNSIIAALNLSNIEYDIFDRCFYKSDERFKFPQEYSQHVIGHVPVEDMWKIHKAYRYQINVNSVKNSSTMFARRVFESLASGTPVISNYSKGVEEMFKGIVLMSDNSIELAKQIQEVEGSNRYDELVKKGINEVMRNHTYSHRIKYICDLIGIHINSTPLSITMKFFVSNIDEAIAAQKAYYLQSWDEKKLLLIMEPFEGAYHLLNKATENELYFLNINIDGIALFDDSIETDFCVVCDPHKGYTETFLEDYIYMHMGDSV